MNRRALIAEALDKATPRSVSLSPKPGEGPILHRLKQLRPNEHLRLGEAMNFQLSSSPEERDYTAQLYQRHAELTAFGKHAPETTQEMLSRLHCHPLTERYLDGLDVDVVTRGVIERRGGSDSDRPLPELDRRDHISAAIDAHFEE